MSKYAIKINPLVAEDLIGIKTYLSEYSEKKSEETIKHIYSRIEMIADFPDIGVPLSKRVSFPTKQRYFITGDYVIIYLKGSDYVEINRVLNHKQDFTLVFADDCK